MEFGGRRQPPVEHVPADDGGREQRTPDPGGAPRKPGHLTDVPQIRAPAASRRMDILAIRLEQIAGNDFAIGRSQQQPEQPLRPGRRHDIIRHMRPFAAPSGHLMPCQRLSTAARASLSARMPAGRGR